MPSISHSVTTEDAGHPWHRVHDDEEPWGSRNYLWPGAVGESLPRRAARELRVLVLELDEAY